MAQVPDLVINKIKLLISELENNNIKIHKAILFGSYANGSFNEWSDIDLALVSDDFSGHRWNDKDLIRKFNHITKYEISPIPYRVDDFLSNQFALDEIIPNGIEIQWN